MEKKLPRTGQKKRKMQVWLCLFFVVLLCSGCSARKPPPAQKASSTEPATAQSSAVSDTVTSPATERKNAAVGDTETEEEAAEAAFQREKSSKSAVLKMYAEAYNQTKGAGELKGEPSASIMKGTLKLNEKSNSMAENLVNSYVNRFLQGGSKLILPPTGNGYQQCVLKETDIQTASVQEDGGKTTLHIVTKDTPFPEQGKGGAGNLVDVASMEQIKKLVEGQGVSFSDGRGFDNNVTVEYRSVECTVQIDQATGLIIAGEYQSLIEVKAQHVNVAWLKNQSVSATICYQIQYPAPA